MCVFTNSVGLFNLPKMMQAISNRFIPDDSEEKKALLDEVSKNEKESLESKENQKPDHFSEIENWRLNFVSKLGKCLYRPQSTHFIPFSHRSGIYGYSGIRIYSHQLLQDFLSSSLNEHKLKDLINLSEKNLLRLSHEMKRLEGKYTPRQQEYCDILKEINRCADRLCQIVGPNDVLNSIRFKELQKLKNNFKELVLKLDEILIDVECDFKIIKKKMDSLSRWYTVKPVLQKMVLSNIQCYLKENENIRNHRFVLCLRCPNLLEGGQYVFNNPGEFTEDFTYVSHFYEAFTKVLDAHYFYFREFKKQILIPIQEVSNALQLVKVQIDRCEQEASTQNLSEYLD